MPRSYRMGKRGPRIEKSRQKVVSAARALLTRSGFHNVSVEAVASEAGVTRVTVYNQFGSKLGLLEAILADVAGSAAFSRLEEAITIEEPRAALRALIAATCELWSGERELFRRVLALGASDPEASAIVEKQEEARRARVQLIVERCAKSGALRRGTTAKEAASAITALTQFAMFDQLARLERANGARVATLMARLADAFVQLEG